MARKLPISTFSILILAILLSNCLVNAIPGGRTKINDVKTNKDVQELGKYSVDEYNRLRKGSAGDDLKFSKVVEAESQVVSGIKYYLKVEAVVSKSGVSKVFDAEVVVKPWMKSNSKQLLDFKPSSPPARN